MKQKKQLLMLVVLLLILVVVGYFYFDSDKPVVTTDAGSAAQNYHLLAVDTLDIHTDAVEKARRTDYKSSGRNIFSRDLPIPPPPQGPHYDKNHPAPPPPTPPPPPEKKGPPLPAKDFRYGPHPNRTPRLPFFNYPQAGFLVTKGERLNNPSRSLNSKTTHPS